MTNKIIGNDIKSDIHLGDWGMPVAQIITYCELEGVDFDELTIDMLEEIYPNASKKYSADDNFRKKSQDTNKKLSSGQYFYILGEVLIDDPVGYNYTRKVH